MTFLVLMAAVLTMTAQTEIAAFPTADGYGKYVTGGRGGKVYYVTRNDDCTDDELVPGTLRWALRTGDDSPRTILFNTTGTIYLTSKLKMNHPNVSILGQSAPGGGVCLAGYPLNINKDNVIVRYVRFRAGDEPNESLTGLDMENCKHVILDHCSMTWSMEECLTAYDSDYTTVQWCIIGEGLYNSKNSKGARAYATQWGGEHSTMHHSLITNSHSRSPRFNGVRQQEDPQAHDLHVESEFANNVVFNWSAYNAHYGGENASTEADAYNRVYMINNYYRPGPATKKNTSTKRYFMSGSGNNASQLGEWYLDGNKFETGSKFAPSTTVWSDEELEKVNADNYYGFVGNNASRGVNFWSLSPSQSIYDNNLLKTKPALSGLSYETADEAYEKVTTQAGASLPRYDEVDQRLLDEAAGRRDPQYAGATLSDEPGMIDSPADITLAEHDPQFSDYPYLGLRSGEKYIVDSDCDGLPDSYETEKGLNPNDPADATQVTASGYTQLEVYLNGIADGSINKSQYETSETKTEPNAIPTTITISYVLNDEDVVGQLPQSVTINYGKSYTLPETADLTKEGYLLKGWKRTDYNKVYALGETITPLEDRVLEPYFMEDNTKLDPPDENHAYHTPQVAEGADHELVYTPDADFVEANDWVEIAGSEPRFTQRTCLDPEKDDGITEKVIPGITISSSTRVFHAYVTGVATVRAYVAGSNSQGDRVVITAMSSDGAPAETYVTMNELAKNGGTVATRSEVVEVILDKSKKYRLTFTSEHDLDMMVAALLLYPNEYVDPDAANKVLLTTLVSPENAGSVQRSPSGRRYAIGTEVELTAKAAEGYLFKNWTNAAGEVIGQETTLVYTVHGESTVTANFQSYDDYAYIFTNPYYNAEVRTATELLVALGKAKSESAAGRYRIFLHNGVYDLGVKVMTEVPANVSLIGEGMENTTIVNYPDRATLTETNRSEKTPTLYLPGNNTYLQDLTVLQGLNYGTGTITGQAQAVRARGDRQIYKRVRMLGCQDTYYINKSTIRQYLDDCFIAGDVDFIYGDGTAFLNACTIYYNDTRGGTAGAITAPNTPAENEWGIVFSQCTIDGPSAANNNFYLGRPWGDSPAVTYINNTFNIQPNETGWTTMSMRKVLRFHEYGSMDANGNLLDLSKRSISACRPDAASDPCVITAEQAALYTVNNVLSGYDGWAPQALTVQMAAPTLTAVDGQLQWNAIEGAYCYVVCKNGSAIAFTRDTHYALSDNLDTNQFTVRVANDMGGLGEPSNPIGTTGINDVRGKMDDVRGTFYNLSGQRVDATYRGIVVTQGRKRIQ